MYLKRLCHSGNNMFDFHECELAKQKYKSIKTDTLCVTLPDSESETLWGGSVVVVRHRLFNRHLDVPCEQTGLIHLQTLFQLQVGVSAHETLDKLLTESVSPVWVDPTLDRQGMLEYWCRTGQEYPVLTNLLDVFKKEGSSAYTL
jgi:hypothetical protein